MMQVTELLGPCAHCLTPFVTLPEFFITEDEYRERHKEFMAGVPHYQALKHFPLECERYRGTGTNTRILTPEKPFTKLRIKQMWPRVNGFFKYVWLYQYISEQYEIYLSAEQNQFDASYYYETFSELGGVSV